MKIYKYEREAGLTDQIQASVVANIDSNIATDEVISDDNFTKGDMFFRDTWEKEFEKENLDPDLMLVHGILVSTVWNKNDDFFSKFDTVKAMHTPMFKPVNIDHKGREAVGENTNIGVIRYASLVDADRNVIHSIEDKLKDDSKLHIAIGMLLWEQYFPTAVGQIKENIKDGNQFISMEAVFGDFGYALRESEDDDIILLPRNDITSWLTSHLRTFGGTGKVTINDIEYQIGRWIINPVFSGVGFVDKPANPDSIVYEDYISHTEAGVKRLTEAEAEDFVKNTQNSVSFISKGQIQLWLK